jgi:anti-sigma B factor antagonist
MSALFQLQTQGTCAVISLSGRMVGSDDIAEIMNNADSAIQSGSINVICDCSSLEYCNSTGLNFFVRLLTKSRSKGGDCVLVNLQPAVEKLFTLSKLNEIFTSYDSVDNALTSFN